MPSVHSALIGHSCSDDIMLLVIVKNDSRAKTHD